MTVRATPNRGSSRLAKALCKTVQGKRALRPLRKIHEAGPCRPLRRHQNEIAACRRALLRSSSLGICPARHPLSGEDSVRTRRRAARRLTSASRRAFVPQSSLSTRPR